jgi:uncharacterized protein with PIN domain
MRLVDTSAWIEVLDGSAIGRELAKEMPARSQWLVPTMVQMELAKWLFRELGEDRADTVIAFTETCVVADMDTATALCAAQAEYGGRDHLRYGARVRCRTANVRRSFQKPARCEIRGESGAVES